MRISRLQALALAGLLGLAGRGIASTAGKPCTPDPYVSSRAVQLALCNGGFADRQRVAQVYSRELGLSAATAAKLADILAAQQALLEKGGGRSSLAPEPEIRRIESEFILLLNQESDNPRIAEEVSRFYNLEYWFSQSPSPSLLDLVARSANPARLAARLAEHGYSQASAEVLFTGLAVRPETAVLWHRAAQLTLDDPAWKIALLEEACRWLATGEAGRPMDAAPAAAIATELLETQLDHGLVPQALAALQSLPPAVRSSVERGSEGRVKTKVGGLPFEGQMRDLRPQLVAAYLVAGDPQAASRLMAKIEPVPAAKARRDLELAAGENARQALARWLHPSPEDPFDVLTAALTREREDTGMLALARLAERERYPAIAAYCLGLLARGERESRFKPASGVPARVRAAAEATRGEIEKVRQGFADEARADREAARTAFGPDPAAATMGRLLRAPAAVRFAERPLPEGVAPVELPREDRETPAGDGGGNEAAGRFRPGPRRAPGGPRRGHRRIPGLRSGGRGLQRRLLGAPVVRRRLDLGAAALYRPAGQPALCGTGGLGAPPAGRRPPPDGGRDRGARSGENLVDEKTLFLIADRGLFSTLEPTSRVVVLTAEEAEAAKQKFGPFYPQRLELFVFDRAGRRAYVIWNASWQGGQTLLEEQPDGTWTAWATANWIT